jgi:polyisoprenoid-binding protein YceI
MKIIGAGSSAHCPGSWPTGGESKLSSISAGELKSLLDSGGTVRLIDVLPPEYYGERHISGAINACVYEVAFLENLTNLVNDRDTPLVMYGAGARSREASVAVEKLRRAGYREVRELAGGLAAWQAAGYAVEQGEGPAVAEMAVKDGLYTVDGAASRLEWMGRNLNGRHYGTIAVSGGEVGVTKGLLANGSITLDMRSIADLDLKDEGYNRMLVSHLKSDDFFDVDNYPSAVYTIDGAELPSNESACSVVYQVKGSLEMKGVRKDLPLTAEVVPQPDGQLKARVLCDLDRTRWGVLYGSGRFFEKLGMHLVNEIVTVELFLTARRR